MNLQTNASPVLSDDGMADSLSWPGQPVDGQVRLSLLADGLNLPVVIEAIAPGLDPSAWAGTHRQAVEALLCRHGAVLFRGFELASVPAFEAFAEALSPGCMAVTVTCRRRRADGTSIAQRLIPNGK
ncbi:TauD/TfdA family dioxygenase [Pseudomonas corrugata]